MSEFIDREKAIANIKAAYCCGCENYNGVRCRACQIMDAMDVLEDEPAVVPDVQRWRKTAEEPPTEKDSAHGNVLVKYMDATFAQSATWDTVASAPDLFTLWMPMPKPPEALRSAKTAPPGILPAMTTVRSLPLGAKNTPKRRTITGK